MAHALATSPSREATQPPPKPLAKVTDFSPDHWDEPDDDEARAMQALVMAPPTPQPAAKEAVVDKGKGRAIVSLVASREAQQQQQQQQHIDRAPASATSSRRDHLEIMRRGPPPAARASSTSRPRKESADPAVAPQFSNKRGTKK